MNIILYEKFRQIPPSSADSALLQSNIKKLNTSPTLEKRQEYAQYLYWFTGNKFGYLGEDNNFLLYTPSKGDESEKQKFLELEEKWKTVSSSMLSQAQTCVLWAMQYILALNITLFITLIIYKKKTNEK